MGYSVTGKIVDSSKQPIPFALVFVSDASGKPVGSNNTTSDIDGKWILNKVEDSDYITSSMVGYDKKTISAKSIIPVTLPSLVSPAPVYRSIQITLPDSATATLQEVVVESKMSITAPKNLGKYVMIGSAGLLLLTGIMLVIGASKKII